MSNVKRSTRAARASTVVAGRSTAPLKTVSGRWVLTAGALALAAAALCMWIALCFVYWQGNWQLLYHPNAHPKTKTAQTPASLALPFDAVDFAVTESGQPQLHGWWIPADPGSRFTAIYLHGADDNIADSVNELALLHAAKINLLAFDYRGYGESRFARPSELHWREDAESAIKFLTGIRHIAPGSIVLVGEVLGANLALETAAAHPELAGVVVEDPLGAPEDVIFRDPRARMVPAHWLVSDRWDIAAAAANLHVPSLWFFSSGREKVQAITLNAYGETPARKMRVWLTDSTDKSKDYGAALSRWLDQLDANAKTP